MKPSGQMKILRPHSGYFKPLRFCRATIGRFDIRSSPPSLDTSDEVLVEKWVRRLAPQ